MKHKINLYWDKWNFGPEERKGQFPSSPSQFIEYTTDPTDVAVFVDYDGSRSNIETIVKNSQQKYKVMVQMEPSSFNRALHHWIIENEFLFDMIIIHYPAWVGSGKYPEKYRYYPSIGKTFIRPEEQKVYTKTKNISAIFSRKNFGLEGHGLRQIIRDTFETNRPGVIEFNNPEFKADGIKDYRYEIVIENEFPYFLSEKPLDSMLCGCIPVVWGHPQTKQWEEFDTNGMVFFENEIQLLNLIDSGILNEEFYHSKLDSIQYNFEIAKKYLSFGDIIWKAGLKEFF